MQCMKTIDLSSWRRRTHFDFFRGFADPHMRLCTELEAPDFARTVRSAGVSPFLALTFAAARAASGVPEFRTRMRSGPDGELSVVEHQVVHPVVTVPMAGGYFNFCMLQSAPDLASFVTCAKPRLRAAEARDGLFDESAGRDDVIYMTSSPWFSFTSVSLPMHGPGDNVPRVAWGKLDETGAGRLSVAVIVHHALVDALHIAQFLERFQAELSSPLSTWAT